MATELNSLALEACIRDNGTYFGRIPRDIVSLINDYIKEPIRLDVIQYTDLEVWDRYEDRILLSDGNTLRVYNVRGELLAQWDRTLYTMYHLLIFVSKEEVLITRIGTSEYSLYNFISAESRDLEVCDTFPPNGVVAMRLYSLGVAYYDGALYNTNGLEYFLIERHLHSEFIKIGKNSRALPVPDGVVEIAYKSPELTIFYKLPAANAGGFEFHGHKIEDMKCVREALDGVIYIDSEMRLQYMDRNGITKSINYHWDVLSVDIFGAYMFVQLYPREIYKRKPMQCFFRLRT